MADQLEKALPPVLAAVLALGLYFFGRDRWDAAVAVLVALLLVGMAGRALGTRSVKAEPVRGVWAFDAWYLGLVALAAGSILLVAMLAIGIQEWLGDEENELLTSLLTTALSAAEVFFGIWALKQVSDGSGSLWPGALFKKALQSPRGFKDVTLRPGSRAYDAVWEDRVMGEPPISGWAWTARRLRARALVGVSAADS